MLYIPFPDYLTTIHSMGDYYEALKLYYEFKITLAKIYLEKNHEEVDDVDEDELNNILKQYN